jgi:hypothetical protein
MTGPETLTISSTGTASSKLKAVTSACKRIFVLAGKGRSARRRRGAGKDVLEQREAIPDTCVRPSEKAQKAAPDARDSVRGVRCTGEPAVRAA